MEHVVHVPHSGLINTITWSHEMPSVLSTTYRKESMVMHSSIIMSLIFAKSRSRINGSLLRCGKCWPQKAYVIPWSGEMNSLYPRAIKCQKNPPMQLASRLDLCRAHPRLRLRHFRYVIMSRLALAFSLSSQRYSFNQKIKPILLLAL